MSPPGFIKTACQACDGRLELPVDAVGVSFACPRCSTKLTLALKCACINCGGPLSFEVGHIGHTIQCGHCEGSTLLMPSAIVVGDTLAEPVAEEKAELAPVVVDTTGDSKADRMLLDSTGDGKEDNKAIPITAAEPAPESEPQVESAQNRLSAAVTQPLPMKKPPLGTKATGGTPSAPKRPAPPKRPGGAGGVRGPTAPVPKRPDGSGASGPLHQPAGEGVSGSPKRPESPDRSSGSAPPKSPDDSGVSKVAKSGPPKRPAEGSDSVVPEGIKLPGQAPSMPKMDGGSGATGGPPKRPAAVDGPQKQGGVSSPSQAAASREAALAKSKEAALAASEAAEGEGIQSVEKQQRKTKISAAFFTLTLMIGLAWFVVMPYFGWGGDDRFVKARRSNPNATVYRPIFDASAIKVDSGSLSVRTGDAGLIVLKGSVRNGGKESARNIKITLQIAGGTEPIEVTHTVNQEVKPGATFEFSTPLSFDVPENAEIKVIKVEIH